MAENSPLNPLVSICVPVYNCERYLEQSLLSLGNQDYGNLEIIMVNDGSTDASPALIKNAADPKIVFIDAINGGASRARNIALDHSSGQYVLFFDADDYIPPDYVSSQVHLLNGDDDAVAMAAWGRFYGDDLTSFRQDTLPEKPMDFREWICLYWRGANPMTNPGRVLIPRKLIDKAGRWDETLTLYDDFDFFTRVLLQAKRILPNKNALFYYRSGIGGISSLNNTIAHRSFYNAIRSAVNNVLEIYGGDEEVRKSCANMWQLFVYSVFPQNKPLIEKAEQEIARLGGADLAFPAGKFTRILTFMLGWKLVKKIKQALK